MVCLNNSNRIFIEKIVIEPERTLPLAKAMSSVYDHHWPFYSLASKLIVSCILNIKAMILNLKEKDSH